MTSWLAHIGSVLRMETVLRLRRSSTPVVFLILCGAAFLLMPEPGSGGTSFIVAGRRVLLNSDATALTSAVMGGLVLSLAGFYLVSNSIERDRRSGVGRLIAATPLSSGRYLAGKLAGNVVYLLVISVIFMVACMGMHLLRGEAPLEPLVFGKTFAIMFLPLMPSLAALALMFESVPLLSGRGGDIAYFFVWTASLSLPPILAAGTTGRTWLLAGDITGLGFFIREIIHVTHSTQFTIGYAPFNANLPPVVFPGIDWTAEFVVPRLTSVLLVIPFFLVAWISFGRFDPARKAPGRKSGKGNPFLILQHALPVGIRKALPLRGWPAGGPPFARDVMLDTRLTLALSPVLPVIAAASVVFNLIAPPGMIRSGFLPVMFVALVPVLAAISTRDGMSNTRRLLFIIPNVKARFTVLKFCSAMTVALIVALCPLIRLGLDVPYDALRLLVGLIFVASVATFLGLLTDSPKPFAALFLLFLYVVMSSQKTPALDFAGWQGLETPSVMATYAGLSIFMMVIAWSWQAWRNAREG